MIHLLLIEDDLKIQRALSQYIGYQEDFNLIAVYSSAEEFEANPTLLQPNIVILDINLPKKSGIELIPVLKLKYPSCAILMLSVNNDNESVFRSLQFGADGYLGKETPLDKIKDAIVDLYNGGSPITPAIARKVFDHFNSRPVYAEGLIERETQVVNGILKGLSYKLVAAEMDVSIDTVRKYIKSIYRKLQINSKGELMAKYRNT
ncbi:MAG: DNA-binding response regulator [Bacteroidetes bacterium]|nr:MAG: DNA-binding response regulator [Bacteroidota bacterium]